MSTKDRFAELVKDGDGPMTPIERLQAFCSLVGEDWLDVEPFIVACEEEVSALRADRDSLRDALAALVKFMEEFERSEDGLRSAAWEALESARHVLGEKRDD